jgi:DNA-binding NtrC family response regulator
MMTNVLVIEDEEYFAKLLKRSLEKEGLHVELTANLEDGLARARSGEFDAVLADLHLEGESALELTARLRTLNPHLPVIIMTAKHTTETAIEATKHGAYDYFAKPDAMDFDDRSPLSWRWASDLSEMIEKAAESKRFTAKVRLPEDSTTTDTRLGSNVRQEPSDAGRVQGNRASGRQ